MKTRHRIISRTLGLAMLTLMIAGLLCLPQLRSYASGTINVTLSNIEGLDTTDPDFNGFTFKLYRVGSYDGPDFKLEPDYADVNVRIPSREEYDESKQEGDPSWEQAWLDSAATLAKHIEHPADGKEATPVKTFENVKPGDSMSYVSDENALFLLIGSSERVGKQNWKPVPMFVRTLNGTENYTIDGTLKVEVTPVVFEYSVAKAWDGENESDDSLKPKYIEVGIYYGQQLIDTILLGGEGQDAKWTYSWKAKEAGETYYYIHEKDGEEVSEGFVPEDPDAVWDVKEITDKDEMKSDEAKSEYGRLRFYQPSYESNSGETQTAFKITNKLIYNSLELIKEIDGYDADGQNVAFSFIIEGLDSKDKVIYTNHLGVSFDSDEGLVKSVKLDYIPVAVKSIRVTEDYSGNYELDGEPVVTFDEEHNLWKVYVKNKHNNHGPKGGIVNRYDHDKAPAQDGGSEVTD